MIVDISFSVLNGNSPLFVPPVRLCHYAPVDHAEPVMAPEVDVYFEPVGGISDLSRIKHKSPTGSSAGDVGLQSYLGDRMSVVTDATMADRVCMDQFLS